MFSVHCLTKTTAVEICMKKSNCRTFTAKLGICVLFQINFYTICYDSKQIGATNVVQAFVKHKGKKIQDPLIIFIMS